MRNRATELARRSDALYQGNISRRELCDRIAYLEEEIANGKAKEQAGDGDAGLRGVRGVFSDLEKRGKA